MLKRILRFIADNWALKLAAVALALLLWLAVQANEPERALFRNVPVQVDLRDPDWRLEGEPRPSSVNVSVVGPRGELLSLANDPPRILLPVERVNDSIETQVVPPQWVRIPEGLPETRIVAVRPETVRLRYERLAAKTVPVKVAVKGDLPDGLALALPINSNPPVVEVRGPERVLEGLDSVPLLPVELSGLRSTTNVPTQVDTVALGPDVRVLTRDINVILRVVPTDSQPGLRTDTARRRRGAPY